MMNWETYKTLTVEQKEEYNYRFKEDLPFDTKNILSVVTVFFMSITMMLFVVYLCIKEPALAKYKDNIEVYMQTVGVQVYVVTFIILSSIIVYLINVVIRYYKYRKWIKENKITLIYWWSKWLNKK